LQGIIAQDGKNSGWFPNRRRKSMKKRKEALYENSSKRKGIGSARAEGFVWVGAI
jgi:hypothetical protein